MQRLYAIAAVWMALALALFTIEASFAATINMAEKTIPQGQDPPGAENGEQQIPPRTDEEVIPPPPVGDEDIHTEAPNPNAGHPEEVIPPPAPNEEQSVPPR